MIYKFIDNNGSEISVNSLESLQALVVSDTINENTKVKAGLRGKWTTASEIEGLSFIIEEEIQNTSEPEEDIKSFITQSESSVPEEETKEESKTKARDEYEYVEEIVEEEVEVDEENKEGNVDNSDYYIEKLNKQNEEEVEIMGLNLPGAVKTCFKKYFDFKGRASRSEYWYFTLFNFIGYAVGFSLGFLAPVFFIINGIFFLVVIIPWISVAVRRLHDINKSGWFVALPLPAGVIVAIFSVNRQTTLEIIFAIIGFGCSIYLLVLYCSAGDSKQNRFGKNPLKIKR